MRSVVEPSKHRYVGSYKILCPKGSLWGPIILMRTPIILMRTPTHLRASQRSEFRVWGFRVYRVQRRCVLG